MPNFKPKNRGTRIRLVRSSARRLLSCAAHLVFVSAACAQPTTNQLLSLTGSWFYTTNDVGSQTWTRPSNTDTGWLGKSNALLYIETASLPAAKNTALPAKTTGRPEPCYFFRTTFSLSDTNDLVALRVSHLIDDGAIFYLNGAEIQRVRMDDGPVAYTTPASDSPQAGDATAIEFFTLVGRALTNLVAGSNTLAARVHQHGTDSTDVVFGASLAAVRDPDPVSLLMRGPYLQACTPTSIVIRWRTDFEEGSHVACGTNLSSMGASFGDPTPVTEHVATLTNLTPDTVYYYSVGSVSNVLAGGDTTCQFRTHPPPGTQKDLRIWVTGDAGTANDNARAVRNAFESANAGRAVDAWLQLGDNAYDSGTDAQYQAAMFDMYAERLRQTTVWTTMANHETYSTDWNGLYPYLNIFTVPTLGQSGGVASHTELYYSFDIGMVHVVSLDSMVSDRTPSGAMAQWLQADLAANTNRWLLAIFHHPPYTKGSHDSDVEVELVEMRQHILPILESGGADLVLCGHSHSYERSFLLDGHYDDSSTLASDMLLDPGSGRESLGSAAYVKPEHVAGQPLGHRGTVYVVAGSSGKISGGALDHPAMFLSQNTLGSVVLDITAERINAHFLRETGATNDWFSIVKANQAPTVSNQVYGVASEGPTAILLAADDINRNRLTFSLSALPTNGLVSAFDGSSGAVSYTPARGCTNSDSLTFVATDGLLPSPPATVTLRVTPLPDADGDGLPDAWEASHGVSDPAADPDHDGASNLHEYRSGTDPKDGASWLRLVGSARAAAGFQITWSSVGATRYRILTSDGDAKGGFNGVFKPLARGVSEEMDARPAGTPGSMSFTDDYTLTGAPPHGCRYYRVSVIR